MGWKLPQSVVGAVVTAAVAGLVLVAVKLLNDKLKHRLPLPLPGELLTVWLRGAGGGHTTPRAYSPPGWGTPPEAPRPRPPPSLTPPCPRSSSGPRPSPTAWASSEGSGWMSWAASPQSELRPLGVREGWARQRRTPGLTHALRRLVPPRAPSPQLFVRLVGNAFAIAVVGFAIAISLGKIFALRHGYRVDSNQVWGGGPGAGRGQPGCRRPRSLGRACRAGLREESGLWSGDGGVGGGQDCV